MDVIARCAFGVKIDSLGAKDDPFVRNAQFVINPPSFKSPIFMLPCKFWLSAYFSVFPFFQYLLHIFFLRLVVFPSLLTALGDRIFVTKQLKFFFNLLENMLRERSQSTQVIELGYILFILYFSN